MPRRRLPLVLLAFLFLVAAKQRAVQHPAAWPLHTPPRDVFTFSEPSQVTTRHLALDLTVDFETRRLSGSARLDIENLTGTRTLVLDTFALDISKVELDGGTTATWSYGTASPYGRPLRVTIEPTTRSVTIHYTTSPTADGLFWNTAEQSYGRQQPYLYSLNEPVSARTWIPVQDTPTVRMTYEATLRVPRGLLAVMSANGNPTAPNDLGVYTFHMPYRIPAYLVALAVGRLEFHAFDERTGVYAEPELIDDAAWEMSYLPEMVDTAERIAGRYPFARYDVLLAPPTFIVGGMEHPMLNIVQPFSVVTGNRPATPEPSTLVAHELAHSWAGDSATLATWNDVWINEGITSYLTLRILEEMSGFETAELGWFSGRQSYAAYSQDNAAATRLHREVPHPGAGFDATGYTKGSLFIKTLEDLLGRERFDFFLRRYFQVFQYRWVDDQNFVALLRELVLDDDPSLEPQLQLSAWLYEPGLPSNVTAPASSAIWDRVQQLASAFSRGAPLASSSLTTAELNLFFELASGPVRARLAELDAQLAISTRPTPPTAWLTHSILASYEPGIVAAERILMRGGPNGTMRVLYNTLVASGKRDRAIAIFTIARGRYHDDVEAAVAKTLGLTNAARTAGVSAGWVGSVSLPRRRDAAGPAAGTAAVR